MNKKVRRESGRKYNKYYDPENGAYYSVYWNDWLDHRDGFRKAYTDKTMYAPKKLSVGHWSFKPRIEHNIKLNKLLQRRRLQKKKREVL